LDPDTPVTDTGHLAVVLGGSEDSFTGMLLELMHKADPGNRMKLAQAFPLAHIALEIWMALPEPPTFAQMQEIMEPPPGDDDVRRCQAAKPVVWAECGDAATHAITYRCENGHTKDRDTCPLHHPDALKLTRPGCRDCLDQGLDVELVPMEATVL
jgi:hypothetical protein